MRVPLEAALIERWPTQSKLKDYRKYKINGYAKGDFYNLLFAASYLTAKFA